MKILLTSIFSLVILCLEDQDLATLTAVFDERKNNVKLKWQHADPATSKFVLQRSSDNSTWFDIYTLFVNSSNTPRLLSFEDKQVSAGKNYYRLKEFTGMHSETGSSLKVIIGKPGNDWIIYPVPVKDVLNLQYNGSQLIAGVITITIQNVGSGLFFHKLRFASTNRHLQIPVSNLGRGTYDVRIYVSEKPVWNQRFIK